MLDEDNNRFSKAYAPVMQRLLGGECTSKDVDYLNTRVLDGINLSVRDCWDAKFITFRNKVNPFPSEAVVLLLLPLAIPRDLLHPHTY